MARVTVRNATPVERRAAGGRAGGGRGIDDLAIGNVALVRSAPEEMQLRLKETVELLEAILEKKAEEDAEDEECDARTLRREAIKAKAHNAAIGELVSEWEEEDDAGATTGVRSGSFEDFGATLSVQVLDSNASIPASALKVDEDQVLGQGRFGRVFLGRLRDRKVAVKVVNVEPNSMLMFQEQEKLWREAQAWSQWHHRNIVQLFGTCMQSSVLHLVMEFCDTSLHRLLYEVAEGIEPTKIRAIMSGVSRGMAFMHSKGFIHPDIKPRNILLNVDGSVKLCDYGLATARFDPACCAAGGLTKAVRGTLVYMSPEILEYPANWTPRADVYAFAMTRWEVLHRQPPWSEEGMTEHRLIDKVKNRQERPMFNQDLVGPMWMVSLVQKCWAPAVNERPDSVTIVEFLEGHRGHGRARRSTRVVQSLVRMLGSSSRKDGKRGGPGQESTDLDDPFGDVERLVDALQGAEDPAPALQELGDLLGTDIPAFADEPQEKKSLRVWALRYNGLTACVEVVKAFPESTQVVRNGLKCIRFLGRLGLPRERALFMQQADEEGLCELAVQICDSHVDDADVMQWACGVFWTLAMSPKNSAKLMGLGAADCVANAMRGHRDNAEVQEHALGALQNLALHSDNKGVLVTDTQIIPDIVLAMNNHKRCAFVQEYAEATTCWTSSTRTQATNAFWRWPLRWSASCSWTTATGRAKHLSN
ncbi:Mitogen-activated protein kinase kinase kinase 7 [Durusdinium trenchii]|uniref:Mitogen-activated protein kinase kinase kinase 7 n=1 Tax=Durusdinium trenchii TaxID=1381693 RepID=A0ABP0R1Z1_9DINO